MNTRPLKIKRSTTLILMLTGILSSMAVCGIYLIQPAFISSTNSRTTDAVMSLAPANPASGAVVIVDIDNSSLSRYGQWPWPRNLLARLLQTINGAGASSIGLDLILAEPDRSSPEALNAFAYRKPGDPVTPSGIADYDLQLADTLSKGPFVLGYKFLFQNSAQPEIPCELHAPGITWINGLEADHGQQSVFFLARSVVCNRQPFSNAVTHSGYLNATPDTDGLLRRIPMLINFDGRLYPSLTLSMLMKYGNNNQIGIRRSQYGTLYLNVDSRSIPVDHQGNMIVQFSRQKDAIPRISAGDLLGDKIPSQQLNGKIVLVGASASGLEQIYQTPASPVHTHAAVHAQVLDNLLVGRQVVRSREFLVWEALIGLLVAIGTVLAISRLGILSSAAVSIALLAGSWTGMMFIFQARGYLLSPLLPTALVVLNYAILTVIKTWKTGLIAREETNNTLILLKSSEKNLHSIIKAVPDIIFRLDNAGRIVFISPAIAKYTVTPDALLGQTIFDLVVPDDLPKAHYRLNEKRTGERATHGLELRLLLHNQTGEREEARYFSVSAEGIYTSDTPCANEFIGTQGIIHDITEQKKMGEKLQQAQKMEAIGNLAAGVAHDLNNILSGLVTYPELLLMELPPDSPLCAKIALIQRSGQRAAAIVHDLLALGRRGVKTGELVNLNVIISAYLASLEFKTSLKHHPNVSLECNLAPNLLNIVGSKSHLSKVIMNLLNNAVEAMPAGGTIRISSYNRQLDTALTLYEEIPPGEYVCITVSDEGIGIAAEDLQKIFEPFYSKKLMQRSGSGLGMTIIWATVKDLNGYIDIRSREGEGTCFVLYLPANRNEAALPSQRVALEDYIGTEQILVVDDVPEQLQIAASMLTKLGYTVTSLPSGEAAVAYLRSHTVDLVILDMIMPGGMDGLETYSQIIDFRPGQRAIITSGFSESERVKALQKIGVGRYVQKPYSLENLGVAVRKELDRP